MSISSEITRIKGAVADCYDAVETKGGTATTGLIDDLPGAISSIPAAEPVQDNLYGKITYKKTKAVAGTLNYNNCTMTIVDQAKWEAFVASIYERAEQPEMASINFMWADWSGEWQYELGWEPRTLDQQAAGIELTVLDTSQPSANVWGPISSQSIGYGTAYLSQSESNLNCLCNYSDNFSIGGKRIKKNTVVGFEWGQTIPETLGNGFLCDCRNLSMFKLPTSHTFTSIGDSFLSNCTSVMMDMDANPQEWWCLRDATSIGAYFCRGCKGIIGYVEFYNLSSLPNNFMAESGVTQVAIRCNTLTIGDYVFSTCRNLSKISIGNPVSGGSFSGVTSVGSHFCETSIIEEITFTYGTTYNHFFSNSAQSIGDDFFYDCPNFKGEYSNSSYTLYIPSTVSSIGREFLGCCDGLRALNVETLSTPQDSSGYSAVTSSSDGVAYLVGVSLSGAGASAWKTALPDRNTGSSRRKLILV